MSADPDPFRIIANLTHELKTPLHSILSVASILAEETDGPLNDEQKKQVSIIQRNGTSLLDLITDLLSYSSTTSETRKTKITKVRPGEVITSLVNEISPLAEKRNIAIATDTRTSPPWFFTDPSLFSRIVNNLLTNAIKFTPEGGEVYISASEGVNASLDINISDTGIGMDENTRDKLFSAFYQADSGSTRQYGGVGLGLSLVQHAVRVLNGTMEVQSEPAQGSSFNVHLPDISDSVPRYHVLIADSDETIQNSLQMLFENEGYDTTTVSCVEILETLENSAPDIVLLEISSAAGDIKTMIASLRQILSDSFVPVIGMTASCNPRDRSLAIRDGLDELVSKPFDRSELLRKVKLLLDRAVEQRSSD